MAYALFVLFSLACAIALFGFWLLVDTASPIESKSVELLDEFGYPQTHFKRGALMAVDRENCTSRRVAVVVSRELIRGDGFAYVLPSGPYVMDAGCQHTVNGVVIPNHVLPGKYEYWVTLQYSNNPLTSGQLLLKVPELTVLP
jgi:hypothetical protein